MFSNYYIYWTILTLLIVAPLTNADENSWSTNGPYDARVMAIAIHPDNNHHIYLGTVEGGIYQTFNGGEEWLHIDSDILPNNIRVIAIHPTGPDTIYVSTTQGLYKSINAGQSWELIYFPCGWQFEIRALIIHPTQPNIMLVSGPVLSGINYRSADGGQVWEELNAPPVSLSKFVIDPVEDNIVYFSSTAASPRMLVFKSEDYGENWTNIHNNLSSTMLALGLAVDPIDNQTLYICGRDLTEAGNCIYKTTDGGENWFNISPDSLISSSIFSVYVSLIDYNTVFICTRSNGVMRSDDGGENWQEANTGLVGRMSKTMAFDENNNIIYLGTYYNGIYRSLSYGDVWEKISYNISNTYCTDYALNQQNPREQFVCKIDGLYKSSDYGQNWDFIDILYPGYIREASCITIDWFEPENIFIGVSSWYSLPAQTGIFRSMDSGTTWEVFNDGLPEIVIINEIRIGYYENGNRLFAASSDGLYVSDNYAESWYLIDNAPNEPYYSLDISPVNHNNVYAGGDNVYKSSDGGENWIQLNIPSEGDFINEIVCDPVSPDVVYLCRYEAGIFKSTDTGETWEDITNDLPHASYFYVSGLAINPHNTNNLLINSHHYGIFQSHNGGETWVPFNEGLNTRYSIGHTIIDPTDTSRVYLATSSQSVWSITRTPTAIDDNITLPMAFSVSNYPNPFNASTNIKFSLPNSSDVKIDIYDMLGRRVSTIVNEYLFAGYHSVIWNPVDLSSGAYFYRIEAGEYGISKKMILLR